MRRPAPRAALLLLAALAVVSCSDGDGGGDDEATPTTATTAPPPEPLDVVVTNDDGYAGEGLDVLVRALDGEEGVEVTVVAPADDRSGTGGQTTPGPLATRQVATASGFPATAVEGYPADTIAVALDDLDLRPDLVVSGINEGQNLGPVTEVSGTVGAALAAGRRGVPALAVSQGLGEPVDYEAGAEQALAWLRANRADLRPGEGDEAAPVDNLNVPTCAAGEVRGVVEVRLAEEAEAATAFEPPDCRSTAEGADDDVEAFVNGYASLTELTTG